MATKTISKKTEKHYSYRQQGNRYVLYCNGKVHRQPVENGRIVSTTHEELAAKLVEALERGESCCTAESLLIYHYIYCDIRNLSLREFRKEICDMAECMSDGFYRHFEDLIFGVYCDWSQIFRDEIKTFNRYQLVAVDVVEYYYDSYVLPLLIIKHVVRKMENKSYRTVKHEFLDLMDEFYYQLYCYSDDTPDPKEVAAHRRHLSKAIDKFIYYFNLK